MLLKIPSVHLAAPQWQGVNPLEDVSTAYITYLFQLALCPPGKSGKQEESGRRVLARSSCPLLYPVWTQPPLVPQSS